MTESNFEPIAENPEQSVESNSGSGVANLSLAALLGALFRHPARTIGALGDVSKPDQRGFYATPALSPTPLPQARERLSEMPVPPPTLPEVALSPTPLSSYTREDDGESAAFTFDQRAFRPLAWMIGGWVIALFAVGYALRNGVQRTVGDIFPLSTILAGIGLSLFAVGSILVLPFPRFPAFDPPARVKARERRRSIREWLYDWSGQYGARMALAGLSLIFTAGAWIFNANNTFTLPGVFCWFFSVFGWSIALAPNILSISATRRTFRWFSGLPGRVLSFRISWTAIALFVILCVGGYFRFVSLDAYPPEMTSDHVEKVLDIQRIITTGYSPVFLPNNGGRDVAQYYTFALVHDVLGVTINFNWLKVLTGIEGLLGILAAWWWGREMVGESDPELGNLTGLVMAALLAVSYWHIMLSRLGLRIVQTPLIVSLILIYFVRALRRNQRVDYVKAGLLLGVGLYMYQAVRMVPIVLIIGLILALVVPAGSGILRRRGFSFRAPLNVVVALFLRRQYLFNFTALVIVAMAVFAPLGHFMAQYSDSFWQRTSGRLFGDDTIEFLDPVTGDKVDRIANVRDHLDAFRQNMSYFGQNVINAALMFTWTGDHAWVSGEQTGSPEMDRLTGALFVVGLGLWLVRMVRRRDPGDWLIPLGMVIMLFATALSLAYVIEVPSATRASGALPFAYGFAAFAGALILRQAWRTLRGNAGRGLVVVVAVFIWLFPMAAANANTYFNKSMADYRESSQPHTQGGQILRGFEDSTGAPGNAFMIAYVYWWDHRAVAIAADDVGWHDQHGILRDNPKYPNDVVAAVKANIIAGIKASVGTRYEIRPDRQMLFFLNQNDQQVLTGLQGWLPSGTVVERIQSFTPAQDFIVLIAPPAGCDWLNDHVGRSVSALCPAANQSAPASSG
ncbi:MAG: hypothetical protein ACYDEO_07705 [Aggregatilineales bacterium]